MYIQIQVLLCFNGLFYTGPLTQRNSATPTCIIDISTCLHELPE